ncbi:hypothetical protein SAMN05444172_2601 [Burkholderia sp. GAS332]|nr:hypothetical protein SAMN05444172_2601 [Burkholderia sp. GAS332]
MTNPGSKAWAHKLVDEYEKGKPIKPTNVYRVAYEALGLVFPEGRQPCAPAVPVVAAPSRQSRPAPVPVPTRPPVEDPWWDSEPPAADSN